MKHVWNAPTDIVQIVMGYVKGKILTVLPQSMENANNAKRDIMFELMGSAISSPRTVRLQTLSMEIV